MDFDLRCPRNWAILVGTHKIGVPKKPQEKNCQLKKVRFYVKIVGTPCRTVKNCKITL